MAMEAQSRLEAKRVARTEPDRQHARISHQSLEEIPRRPRGKRNLESVLSGIAGARDDRPHALEIDLPHIHETHQSHIRMHARKHGCRQRTLKSNQRIVEQFHRAVPGEPGFQQRQIVLLASGVHHQQQMVAAIGDHQIVADPATLTREHGVALPPLRQVQNVDGHERLESPRRIGRIARGRPHFDLPHVTDVESARGGADMQMLRENSGRIMQRHLVTREVHEAGSERPMHGVERRLFHGFAHVSSPIRAGFGFPETEASARSPSPFANFLRTILCTGSGRGKPLS